MDFVMQNFLFRNIKGCSFGSFLNYGSKEENQFYFLTEQYKMLYKILFC